MKTLAIILSVAALLVTGLLTSGYHPDAADFTAIFFSAGLAGWVFQEYSRKPRVLLPASRPLRLSPPARATCLSSPVIRIAA